MIGDSDRALVGVFGQPFVVFRVKQMIRYDAMCSHTARVIPHQSPSRPFPGQRKAAIAPSGRPRTQ